MKPMNFPKRKNQRREEAKKRNSAWQKLTPEQKIASLDQRLGKDVGAKKQRLKIKREMEKSVSRKPKGKQRKAGSKQNNPPT